MPLLETTSHELGRISWAISVIGRNLPFQKHLSLGHILILKLLIYGKIIYPQIKLSGLLCMSNGVERAPYSLSYSVRWLRSLFSITRPVCFVFYHATGLLVLKAELSEIIHKSKASRKWAESSLHWNVHIYKSEHRHIWLTKHNESINFKILIAYLTSERIYKYTHMHLVSSNSQFMISISKK